jgi:hypothetical protein
MKGSLSTQSFTDASSTEPWVTCVKSPLNVSGYLDTAVRKYTEWQQSRFKSGRRKDEIAACKGLRLPAVQAGNLIPSTASCPAADLLLMLIRAKCNPHSTRSLYFLRSVTLGNKMSLSTEENGLVFEIYNQPLINVFRSVPNLETRRPSRDRGSQSTGLDCSLPCRASWGMGRFFGSINISTINP